MSLPCAQIHEEASRYAPARPAPSSPDWSFTASTGPTEQDNALVVYRLSVANLGIDDLSQEIASRCGTTEAVRWRRARTRDYIVRLRDQLRLHVSHAELIVHADEADADARLQVIATVPSGDVNETARIEQEIADRVQAISKRAWIAWSEGLRLTLATMNKLEQ